MRFDYQQTRGPAPRGEQCPSLEELGEYAAGEQSSDKAAWILAHVADCEACGALLADVYGEEPPPSGGQLGIALSSGTAAWRKNMLDRIAREMDATGAINSSAKGGRMRSRWWAAAAAAVLVAGGAAWWNASRTSPDAAFSLIADAYTARRPFELRIPGAGHAALRLERGGLDSPEIALLDARSLIARRLKESSGDARWLRASARADLLEMRYASAIESLRQAQESQPDDPGILGDLGIAYLQRAESESRPQDIAQALEYLSRAVQGAPPEPAYRFNLALAYERQPAPRQALEEWNALLELEPSGAWPDEARAHVARLQGLIDRQAGRPPGPQSSEEAITALAAAGFRSTPSLNADAVAADLAKNHGDPWMQDFLRSVRGTRSQAALDLMEAGAKALAEGGSGQGEDLWRRAAAAFGVAGNVPGAVFAAFEHAFELQRLSRAGECEAEARRQLAVARGRAYRWLEIQLRLTLGACLRIQGRYDIAYQSASEAQTLAEKAGYTILKLRALGFKANFLRSVGSYREAVELDAEGLERFWAGEGSLARGYQFYYDMAMATSGLQHPRAAASLMKETIQLAPDRYVEAIVRALYADILVEDQRIQDAIHEFDESERIFAELPDSSKDFYRSYAQISRARLDGREKRVEEGLERLARLESMLGSIRNSGVEAQLWSVKSELLERAGRGAESEELLRRVLALGSEALAAAPGAGDPALAREVSRAVGGLSDRRLQRGEAEAAWGVWNTYNPSFRTIPPEARAARLTYADLPSGPVVWISDTRGVRAERLPASSGALRRLAESFRRAIGNPEESTERIRGIGRQLYAQLIGPIQDELAGAATLYIAADGPFAAIPFTALVSDDGSWLADRFRVVYSPPVTGAPAPAPPAAPKTLTLTAAGYGQAAQVLQSVLPPLRSVAEDLEAAAGALPNGIVLQDGQATVANVRKALTRAGVFHFSGHAIVTAGDAALVLAPGGPEAQERLLWASQIPKQGLRQCRLVMLAACSTGRAAGEDSDPSSVMARAFLMMGVPEVIASRWDVDSRATSALVQRFYQEIAGGASSGEALAAAVLYLRQQQAFAHPYYWAAFDLFRS